VPISEVMEGRSLILCGLDPAIADHLRSSGYEVETAAEGWRAIELAERVHPDAVVAPADLSGPGADELIRRVRRSCPGCGVLMILDEPGSHEAAHLLRAGADGILLGDPDPGYVAWALDQVAQGGVVLAPPIARELVGSLIDSVLREREWARALSQRAQQVEALSRAKADFIGNLSHELRTPLTIIKGVAATLARAPSTPAQGQLLAEAEAAADKLTGMIETILTQAEVTRGEFVLDFRSCDVAAAVREGAAEAAARYPELQVDVSAPDRIIAVADLRAIRGVVRQLVDNACRYTTEGGRVTVKATRSDEGVSVHVTDRGPGVMRGQIAAAFGEAFSPGEDVMTKQLAGLGIGLNLARSLLALHGGILWAEPLPGGGTRVSFTIPAEGPAGGQPPTPETSTAAASTSS
jgi:signal transduction histidine kinase